MGFKRKMYQVMFTHCPSFFFISNVLFKVPLPEDDFSGPESEDDNDEPFSSVTVPIIKTVVHNGRTLVYRIQDSGMDQEKPSEPISQSVSHCDATLP
jgi:hypothetical protein